MARQFSSAFLAFLFTLAAFGGAAGPAIAGGTGYKAEVAAAPPGGRLVIRETAWRCDGGTCMAPRGNSRPAIECAALARKVGKLASFAVGGQPLAAEDLEKCNARAR